MAWLGHNLALATLARAMLWFVLASLVFIPLEALAPARRASKSASDFLTNLEWYVLNSIVTLPLLAVPAALLASGIALLVPAAVPAATEALPLWLRMVLAMVVGEIGFYWGHRWSHEWPWLWRFHAVHHAPERMTYLVNTRMHPVDMLFTRLCGLTLLYITGLAAPTSKDAGLVVAAVLVGGSLWSYFIHANVRWRFGPFEHVLATPAFHHWHHARSGSRGHNYASMLPVMDHVFGSLHLPRAWPEDYGITGDMPRGTWRQLAAPFRQTRNQSVAERDSAVEPRD